MSAFRRLVEQGKDLLDVVRLQGLGIAVCQLKAGPAVRIVARRDHDRALAFQVILREVSERGERKSDIKYVDALLQKRVDGGFCKRRRAGAVVVADDRARDFSAAQIFGICFYDSVYVFGAKLLVAYSSADVVFAEPCCGRPPDIWYLLSFFTPPCRLPDGEKFLRSRELRGVRRRTAVFPHTL